MTFSDCFFKFQDNNVIKQAPGNNHENMMI